MEPHEVKAILRDIETEFECRVLYCCESGSRAWGFASPDSDFDVRFVYAHRREWYLELQQKPSQIDRMLPGDIDLTGWDLRKTLELFKTCNLGLNEWFDSPEVYDEAADFRETIRKLIPNYFNPKKSIYHYLSLARNTWEKNFEDRSIKIKKLFYILRPLMAALWIEQCGTMPPTSFHDLRKGLIVPESIQSEIDALLEAKKDAVEAQPFECPGDLYDWLVGCRDRLEMSAQQASPGDQDTWGPLNQLFLKETDW